MLIIFIVEHVNWMIEHKETCRPVLRFANSDGMGYVDQTQKQVQAKAVSKSNRFLYVEVLS
ncbi:hypothetical protein Hanom_Chr12g01116911 [Helianthus anomalus]